MSRTHHDNIQKINLTAWHLLRRSASMSAAGTLSSLTSPRLIGESYIVTASVCIFAKRLLLLVDLSSHFVPESQGIPVGLSCLTRSLKQSFSKLKKLLHIPDREEHPEHDLSPILDSPTSPSNRIFRFMSASLSECCHPSNS